MRSGYKDSYIIIEIHFYMYNQFEYMIYLNIWPHDDISYVLINNVLINIMPHYPGLCRVMVGHLTCFNTKTCPICGEFDCSPYACVMI